MLQSVITAVIGQKIAQKMRTQIFTKINKLPLNYFDTNSTGDTLSRMTNDADTVSQTLNQTVSTLMSSIMLLIGLLIAMFATS
jgi:ATP-binding cassette subfamily B protein